MCIFILHALSTRRNEIRIWTLVLAAELLATSVGTTGPVTVSNVFVFTFYISEATSLH